MAADRAARNFDLAGLLSAAILAPGIATVWAMAAIGISEIGPGTDWQDVLRALPGLLFLVMLATFLGAVQSLIFGGAVLLWLFGTRPLRTRVGMTAAGGLASGLYLAASLGLHAVMPGAGLILAPWASALGEVSQLEGTLMMLGILASGPCAGAIYASVALRG
ncbi:hypothetical protein [Brevundimonas sp.]|jgi:hypothetical protein|uniref:hypothetical protein n=1 Tax=Brevundimonas sp. TaxID=1871086 RepID=UPI002E141C77|nr:hypothetical protein [Brevundimonas sp.]